MKTPEEIKRGLACSCVCSEIDLGCKTCPYLGDNCPDVHSDALAYIQQREQRVPRWISVEERMPDKSHDWVLIIGKWESDGGWIVPRVAEYREGIWMTNGTGWNKIEDLHIKITHWMPLPELPEEGV